MRCGEPSGEDSSSSDVYTGRSISPLSRRAVRSRESRRPAFGGVLLGDTRSLLLSFAWRRLEGLREDSRRSFIGRRLGLTEELGRSSLSPPRGGERCAERPSRDSTCEVVSFAGGASLLGGVAAVLGVARASGSAEPSPGGAKGPSAQQTTADQSPVNATRPVGFKEASHAAVF